MNERDSERCERIHLPADIRISSAGVVELRARRQTGVGAVEVVLLYAVHEEGTAEYVGKTATTAIPGMRGDVCALSYDPSDAEEKSP